MTIQIWETTSNRRLGRALGGLAGESRHARRRRHELLAADCAGNAFRWALDQDPSREICAIVGRAITAEEWDVLAGGALSDHDPSADLRDTGARCRAGGSEVGPGDVGQSAAGG